jgi:transcriptional regulator with XRE-family HTH domain
MTSEYFRDRLAALGLSQQAFGRLARVDARTVQRWALGERGIPGTVETILDLLDAAAEKTEVAGE